MGLWTPPTGVEAEPASTPWEIEPWGGYGRYQGVDDGTWYQMLEPLANGYGLFVAYAAPDLCCWPANAQASMQTVFDDGSRIPWLFPSVVRWFSGIDPNTGIAWPELTASDDDLEGPPVIITDHWFIDDSQSMLLVNTTGNVEMQYEEIPWQTTGPPAMGIAVPWQLIPLPADKAVTMRDHIADMRMRYDTHTLSISNCDIGNNWGETDEWRECHHDDHGSLHPCKCHYEPGMNTCACGETPTYIQQYVSLRESDVEGHHFITPEDLPIWNYALDRYVAGHRVNYNNMEAGDAWSSSSWRRLSPFSGSASLDLLLQRQSDVSTTSATPQGSSPGSSQLLMPFAS